SQERVLTATTQILEENQRELIRLERLSLAGLLTANIFHDIRKPVTNIKHELDDLSEALGGFSGAARPLKNMSDQVQLFFDILRDLNIERFVRADQMDEEYVDVNRVIEQSLKLVQYERGSVHLRVNLADDLPLVLTHPYRLIQVFSNIALNAYQASGARGELQINTKVQRADRSHPDLDHVMVEIIDDGPGIPVEDQPYVFSPFYTTKPEGKGTGLGLYISRMIVEQIGGAIEVESQAGNGTRFVVYLPAAE
ncbi:hypothetical protein HQ520_03895, partial [bacterium]|nr:hypothetical protein [bacterium]